MQSFKLYSQFERILLLTALLLEEFAKWIINETLEKHQFNCRQEEDVEKFGNYVTELKILSINCGFCETCFLELLRARIVSGINSDVFRKYLLAEKDLTLEKAMENVDRMRLQTTEWRHCRKRRLSIKLVSATVEVEKKAL